MYINICVLTIGESVQHESAEELLEIVGMTQAEDAHYSSEDLLRIEISKS